MTKAQRIEARRQEHMKQRQDEFDESEEDEDEAERRARMRAQEKAADLAHAEDLFGDIQVTNTRSTTKPVVTSDDPNDPTKAIDLSSLALFKPNTKEQFAQLRETLVPLLSNNAKKAHYVIFLQEFTKQICKDLPSDQIKKVASALTTLSNEKMKEEKAADKGGKKTKAAKTKTSLVATRDVAFKADTSTYDDFGECVISVNQTRKRAANLS
jgi:translation initiation factor 3 subunit J